MTMKAPRSPPLTGWGYHSQKCQVIPGRSTPGTQDRMCASSHRAIGAEAYLQHLSGQEKEPHVVSMDHSYARAWNAHPDSHHARPAKLLFMKNVSCASSTTFATEDAPVDVESWTPTGPLPYDSSRVRSLMSECERNAGPWARSKAGSDDWDREPEGAGWSNAQRQLVARVVRLLHADRLARLAYQRNANEPVLRRLAVDRAASRMRRLLGSYGWDARLLKWLHAFIIEKASPAYLAAYLDILQALRARVPTLVDKMVARPEALNGLLRRPWDPAAAFLSQHKPKRLPGSPLLVLCPGRLHWGSWPAQLSLLGQLVVVQPTKTAGAEAAQQQAPKDLVAAVRAKVHELKTRFRSRPIVLIGWKAGGLVACQVSLLESVAAVVCLAFPLVGLSGPRDVDDPLLDSPTPTLFVVGQNALSCGTDRIEDFREQMKAVSGLVVVGGADDGLRMGCLKKRLEGVTQSMVDRCLLEEVASFLQSVLGGMHVGAVARPGGAPARCIVGHRA